MTFTTDASRRRANRSWRALGERLRAIPPQSVGRGLIALALVGAGLWLAAVSWPSLAPYLIGGLIGYAALPLVNGLDRVMPRALAAILALLVVLGLIVAFVWLVVPPLITGLGKLADLIPQPGDVSGSVGDIEDWIATLPEPIRLVVLDVFRGVISGLGDGLGGLSDAITAFIIDQSLGLLSTINFVFGLFVLPVWLTSLMTGERLARQQGLTFLPPSMRADGRAVARIVDRSASTFLRSRVLLAFLTGVFIYGGLAAAQALGVQVAMAPNAQVAAATLLGVLQLIPELGLLIGFLPVLLVAAVVGPIPGLVLGGTYLGSEMLAARIADTRVRGGARELHPVLLIPAIVAMSQFGLIWLFLAAPLVGTIVDLARYGYGRLGDPPTPAGVIPGEAAAAEASRAAAAPIPSAYQNVATREGVTSA